MARPTHYDILGTRRGASPTELRDAYLRAQKRYHPDRAHDDVDRRRREAAARLINESYTLLRDPEIRAKYDAALLRAAPFWTRLDPGPLFRGRGTWLLRIQLPDVPRMPRLQRASAIINEIWSTRGGQWGLLLSTIVVVWILLRHSPALPVALLGTTLLLGGLLARGGAPTPATDAEAMLSALGEMTERLTLRALSGGRGARQRLADLRAEYESRHPD